MEPLHRIKQLLQGLNGEEGGGGAQSCLRVFNFGVNRTVTNCSASSWAGFGAGFALLAGWARHLSVAKVWILPNIMKYFTGISSTVHRITSPCVCLCACVGVCLCVNKTTPRTNRKSCMKSSTLIITRKKLYVTQYIDTVITTRPHSTPCTSTHLRSRAFYFIPYSWMTNTELVKKTTSTLVHVCLLTNHQKPSDPELLMNVIIFKCNTPCVCVSASVRKPEDANNEQVVTIYIRSIEMTRLMCMGVIPNMNNILVLSTLMTLHTKVFNDGNRFHTLCVPIQCACIVARTNFHGNCIRQRWIPRSVEFGKCWCEPSSNATAKTNKYIRCEDEMKKQVESKR